MSRMSPHEIRKVEDEMFDEKTENQIMAAAIAENQKWQREHPTRTAIPPFNIKQARRLAQERDRLGRELTAAERDAVLQDLRRLL